MFKSYQANIASNYTIAPRPTCTTGAWQVFAATHKKSAKAVSVFVFDKKTLEVGGLDVRSSSSSSSSQRKVRDQVLERLKKEASSLARLRHPSVLELAEPVEETRNGMMFATEPVSATLAGLLTDKDTQEGSGSRTGRSNGTRGSQIELDELEIQKGLQQVAKGLEFLHESAGLVHGNLTPDAIYINAKSDWKIAALGFSGPPDNGAKPGAGPPIALSELLYNDPRLPGAVQLNLDYTSPDFVLDSSVSSAADMFSLGLIMIALYNSPHRSPVKTHANSSTYKKIFSSANSVPTSSNNFLSSQPLPPQLKSHVLPKLITRRAANRMSARDFQQSAFFDNVLVSTLQFLDNLPAKTANEKSQYMRGLPRILDQFPRSVLEKKLLPGLLEETKDRDLLALILGNVFKVLSLLKGEGQRAFVDHVVPKLKEVFPAGSKSERDSQREAGLVIVLDNLGLIIDNCDGKIFKDDILPVYALGLESPTSALADKALSNLSLVLPKLDFSTIKNELFPVVATVFAKTSSLMIKVRGLEALSILCGGQADVNAKKSNSSILDKYTVQEKVVPLVKAIKTKEPTVMMAALALFRSISDICDYDFLATNVLPIIWAFSLGPLLNLEQFNKYMELIQSMSNRIQQEHARKLRELATTNGEQNGANEFGAPGDLMGASTGDDFFAGGAPPDDFTSLVLGKKAASPAPSSPWESSVPQTAQAAASKVATFSPIPPPTQPSWSGSALQPSQSISRAITPDSMLGSIPALQPSGFQQQTAGLSGTGGGTNNNMSMNSLMQSMPSSTSPWTAPALPPAGSPASQSMANNNGFAATRPNQTSIDWGKAQQQQSHQLPSALQPTSYMTAKSPIQQTPFQQQPQQQQQYGQSQQQQKTGLDRYESLI